MDPTFRLHINRECKEVRVFASLMLSIDPPLATDNHIGDRRAHLRLEIYVESMKLEYSIPCMMGRPQVAFRETVTERANFACTHKRWTGGAGQCARGIG